MKYKKGTLRRRRASRLSRRTNHRKTRASRASRASRKGGKKPMGLLVVRYYMIGCPHCEASEPAWKKFKEESEYETEEHEANEHETQEEGVTGFPTYRVKKQGKVEKEHAGALMTPADIKKALGLD